MTRLLFRAKMDVGVGAGTRVKPLLGDYKQWLFL